MIRLRMRAVASALDPTKCVLRGMHGELQFGVLTKAGFRPGDYVEVRKVRPPRKAPKGGRR